MRIESGLSKTAFSADAMNPHSKQFQSGLKWQCGRVLRDVAECCYVLYEAVQYVFMQDFYSLPGRWKPLRAGFVSLITTGVLSHHHLVWEPKHVRKRVGNTANRFPGSLAQVKMSSNLDAFWKT